MHWCKLTLLCVAFLASVEGSHVILVQDKEQVLPGERVTFACEVHDMEIGYFVRWERFVGDLNPINLATNRFMESAFRNSRLSTTVPNDPKSNPLIFSLIIDPVDLGDSGMFRCSILGGQIDRSDDANLTVVRAVTQESILFTNTVEESSTEIIAGEEIKFKAGDPLNVLCVVSQVLPTPQVMIKIDDMELEAGVTSTEETHFKVINEEQGLVEKWVTVSKRYEGTVGYELIDKEVSCTGKIPGREEEEVSKGFIIKFDSVPPKITCQRKVFGLEWGTDHRLTCNVTARPPITDFNVTYYRNNQMLEEYKRVLVPHVVDEYYGLEINANKSQVTLIIYQTFTQHFRTYTFTVANAVGKSSAELKFVKDPAQVVTGSANAPTCVMAMGVTLVLMTILSNHITYTL